MSKEDQKTAELKKEAYEAGYKAGREAANAAPDSAGGQASAESWYQRNAAKADDAAKANALAENAGRTPNPGQIQKVAVVPEPSPTAGQATTNTAPAHVPTEGPEDPGGAGNTKALGGRENADAQLTEQGKAEAEKLEAEKAKSEEAAKAKAELDAKAVAEEAKKAEAEKLEAEKAKSEASGRRR